MQLVQFAKWLIESAPDATQEAYARIDSGGAERCGCEECFNFANARHLIYPTEVIDLLEWLGIDPLLETEVTHVRRLDSGLHTYCCVFHLVGELVEGQARNLNLSGRLQNQYLVEAGDGVSLAFSADASLAPDEFRGQPIVELEFSVDAPWISNAPEPP